MKVPPSTRPLSRSALARCLLPSIGLFWVSLSAAAADEEAAKTYTLFMGEDISVMQAGVLRPVRDISGGSWVVGVNGQPVLVSAKDGPIDMKMAPSLKLTDVSATLSKLKSERAYTLANDPSVRLTRSLSDAASLNAGSHAAVNQANAAQNGAMSAVETGANSATGNGPTGALRDSTVQQLNSAEDLNLESTAITGGSDPAFKDANKDSGDFDALDVSFEISAGRHLSEPFIVMITRFHERGAAAGTSRKLVYARALEPVDEKATRVKVEQAGFPPGYQLQGFEIHLYDRGNEVATNVAPKREEFTEDEAFKYLKTKYIETHPGETLAAVPVMIGKLPTDLQERLAAGRYADKFFVKVSKDGLAFEPYADAACSKKIEDPYLEAIVRSVRFEPALAQGRAVDGVASLNLTQLRRT